MTIKAGQIIHVAGEVLIDRIQTGGPGQLNIPTEKIRELGNYESVATIRETPDLSFTLESFDVSTEIEALVTGKDDTNPNSPFELANTVPLDVAGQFKAGQTATDPFLVVKSVAIPQLSVESISYRFGLRDSARQTVTLRGDSIYYNPGATLIEEFTGDGSDDTFPLTDDAYKYVEAGVTRYSLNVSVDGQRQLLGVDFTETVSGSNPDGSRDVIIDFATAPAIGAVVRVVYSTPDPQTYLQSVHPNVSVKPAAVRGRDIDVYVGGSAASDKWAGVQSANLDYRVTIDKDEEFGNHTVVSQDYADVPSVTGAIELKPSDPAALWAKIHRIANVSSANEVVGALSSTALPVWVVIKHPDTGTPIKSLYVPDARLLLPGYSGQVQQKLTVTINLESDSGVLKAYRGAPV